MINNFCIIMVLVTLVLAVPVCAKPEKITMGPYNVSFDMGRAVTHYTSSKQSDGTTLDGAPYTQYTATIEGITLMLRDYHGKSMRSITEEYVTVALKSRSPLCGEPMITSRTIDGKPGVVGKQDCILEGESYVIGFPIDYPSSLLGFFSGNAMTIMMEIYSTVPSDEGTSNLVKTIHVEKK